MKRNALFLYALFCMLFVQAQSRLRVWQSGNDEVVEIAEVGDMVFNGSSVLIKGVQRQLSAIDSIVVVPRVAITFDNASAKVDVPASVASDIIVSVNGADVAITNANTENECEFVLSGTSADGHLTYNGAYKCTFILDNLNLTSAKGSPLDIQCGKRVALELKAGTQNNLVDAASGSQKACLYCKGHLEIEGSGSLTVTGNARHAIASKEYMQLKKNTGSITIAKAASDAIHAGQYFQMNGGSIAIDGNTVADGIQAEAILLADGKTIDPNEELNGQVILKGGTIKATITHEDCKGIKADTDVKISGGSITIDANGNGSRGIQTDGNMHISEADNATTINITAAGGLCTQSECAADPHRCMGMKIDGNLIVDAGTIVVYNTGKKSRGIKLGGTYTKNGGSVTADIK